MLYRRYLCCYQWLTPAVTAEALPQSGLNKASQKTRFAVFQGMNGANLVSKGKLSPKRFHKKEHCSFNGKTTFKCLKSPFDLGEQPLGGKPTVTAGQESCRGGSPARGHLGCFPRAGCATGAAKVVTGPTGTIPVSL